MIIKNLAEEFLDFLDSPTWMAIVKMMETDAKTIRRNLLTYEAMTNERRYMSIAALRTYKNLCLQVYDAAGRKMPPELFELFTGSTSE